ncbi:hypothetical protein ACRRTK_013098 [Alexandromys fortis]
MQDATQPKAQQFSPQPDLNYSAVPELHQEEVSTSVLLNTVLQVPEDPPTSVTLPPLFWCAPESTKMEREGTSNNVEADLGYKRVVPIHKRMRKSDMKIQGQELGSIDSLKASSGKGPMGSVNKDRKGGITQELCASQQEASQHRKELSEQNVGAGSSQVEPTGLCMEGSVAKERGYTVKSPGTQGAGQKYKSHPLATLVHVGTSIQCAASAEAWFAQPPPAEAEACCGGELPSPAAPSSCGVCWHQECGHRLERG